MIYIKENVKATTIENKSFGNVSCFIKLRDNHTILSGCDKGTFCFYDMNIEQYKKTKKNHNGHVCNLLLINDNIFLSCSYEQTIILWKY